MIIFTSFITMVICFVRITPTLPIHRLSASKDINFNDRKYAYVVWKLSDDSEHLKLRSVNRDVIPKEKKNSTAVAKFLEENANNPDLLGEEIQFNKET